MKESIVKIAKEYAIGQHEDTNHTYDTHPYWIHLEQVFYIGLRFIHVIDPKQQENVLAALWCHGLIEDCRITYNDLKNATNETVADLVYAVTNEKGKTRSERANDKYYDGIKNTDNAIFVKLCDRIANVQYSRRKSYASIKEDMFDKYSKENNEFLVKLGLSCPSQGILYAGKYIDVCIELCDLINGKQINQQK